MLMLSACSGAGETTDVASQGPAPTTGAVHAVLQEALGASPGLGQDDLVARIGPPVRERTVATAGDEDMDSLRTLIYYGLEISYPVGGMEAGRRPTRMALTDARYTSPEGLRVGYAEGQVRKLLGPPLHQELSRWVYEKREPVVHDLIVLLEQHKVSRVEWHFH